MQPNHKLKRNNAVAELIRQGELSFSQIGEMFGMSRQRVQQIGKTYGLASTYLDSLPSYPIDTVVVCRRCSKEFSYKKQHASHTKYFCGKRCLNPLKYRAMCYKCHSTDRRNLLSNGSRHGRKSYICRSCARIRYKKYGNYITTEAQRKSRREAHKRWYKRNAVRLRKMQNKWWHANKCKCHKH